MRLRELAQARPRFGYLRLHVRLRREGWQGRVIELRFADQTVSVDEVREVQEHTSHLFRMQLHHRTAANLKARVPQREEIAARLNPNTGGLQGIVPHVFRA